ncbi:MAG: hypothetical protein ACREFZ_12455, partial [Acetobacteraceae bacterium]
MKTHVSRLIAGLRWGVSAAMLAGGTVMLGRDPVEPPSFASTLELSALGRGQTDGAAIAGGASGAVSATALARFPCARDGFYATIGAQVERYAFSRGPISRLQDVATTIGIEYYRAGEKAAAITAHPGFYFGGHPSARTADVPIDAVTGVPLIHGLD